jgi:hypothetical protein
METQYSLHERLIATFREIDVLLLIGLIRKYQQVGSDLYCNIEIELNSRAIITVRHLNEDPISLNGNILDSNKITIEKFIFTFKPTSNSNLFILEECNSNSKI